MAFFTRVGNVLRQTSSKPVTSDLLRLRVNSSIFQAIRCMSSSKVFVGGVSYSTDDQSLKEAFARYGEVLEARVIMDRETGRSRGFAFVTYTSSEEASSAIQALDGQELHGRRVKVDYATERPRSNFGGDGYGGGGGYGGGWYGGGEPAYANNSVAGGGYGGGASGPDYSSGGSGGYGESGTGNYNSTSNYAAPTNYSGGNPSFSNEGGYGGTNEPGLGSSADRFANSHGSSNGAGDFNSTRGEFQTADDEFGKAGDAGN